MPTFNEPIRPLEFLLAEANGSISREQVTIASGQGALVPGAVLGRRTSGGQFAVYNDAATDGTQTAVAILCYPVDATAAAVPATVIARHAEVEASGLNWNTQGSPAIANGVADLAALDILVRSA